LSVRGRARNGYDRRRELVDSRGEKVRGLVLVIAVAASLAWVAPASADWSTPVGTNVVADEAIMGGGYPVPPGATKPDPGTCRSGLYNANRSESWIAVKPGTEQLVGTSKIFFEKYSTFYDFHLSAYRITTVRSRIRARSRATTACRPAPRKCPPAGPTTPTRTPTSTPRAASTRPRCRSTPSGKAGCIRTAPSP
jgi:hypothetical protein